ncbi:MAG: hypothetical protein JWQ96_3084 [Segetibacter sp.]|nr:hypothetical protein [Segetibacter sp.]
MKKWIFALAISALGFVSAEAQKTKWSLGPNAGFGGSTLSNFQDREGHSAGNVGLALVYSAIEHFGVGADLKYSIEGAERTFMGTGGKWEEKYRLDYLRIPIKAIYFFNDYGDRLRPKVAVGPSFGFLVGGNNKLTNPAGNTATVEDLDQYVNNFDFGITGSAGLNYRLVRNTWLSADLSYLHGLTDVLKGTATDTYANRNLSINLGVNFGL